MESVLWSFCSRITSLNRRKRMGRAWTQLGGQRRSEEAYVADGARNWNIGKDHWARFSFPGHTRLAGIKRPVDKGARRISAPTHSRWFQFACCCCQAKSAASRITKHEEGQPTRFNFPFGFWKQTVGNANDINSGKQEAKLGAGQRNSITRRTGLSVVHEPVRVVWCNKNLFPKLQVNSPSRHGPRVQPQSYSRRR